MRLRVTLMAAVLATLFACESLEKVVNEGTRFIEENPGLIEDEEDREKWTAGARALRSWVDQIDTADEIAIGQSLAVRSFASFGRPHPDVRLQLYVAKVGRLVARQSERPSLPYSFAVVESDEPNALALPGGYVFISTGLLRALNNESELAAVLGHEISHVALKHGILIVGRDRRIAGLVDFGAVLDEKVAKYRQFIDQTFTKLTTEGYDRRYESVADKAGTAYAYHAGYDPTGLLHFLEESRASGVHMERARTHPDPSVRIADVRSALAELGPYPGAPRLAGRYRREVLNRLH